MRSRFFRALLVCAAIGGPLIQRADTVRALSSGVVISQFYGGGGNAGPDLEERLHRIVQQGERAGVAGRDVGAVSHLDSETSRRPPHCPA